jgi:hypothetical protein
MPTLAAAIFWAASSASIIAIMGYQTRANDQLDRLRQFIRFWSGQHERGSDYDRKAKTPAGVGLPGL